MKYWETLWVSLRKFYKNPVLLIPDLIFIFITWLTFQILLPYTGLQTLIGEGAGITSEALGIFYQNYFLEFVAALTIFTFVTFVAGVIYQVLKFNMIREVIRNRQANIVLAWKKRKEFIWRVVILKIYVFLLSMIITLVLGALATGLYFLLALFTDNAIVLASSIGLVLALLAVLIVRIGLLFRYPILFLKYKNPFRALFTSIKMLFAKPGFVLTAWLIIIVINVAFGFIIFLLNILNQLILMVGGSIATFFMIFFAVLFILIDLIPTIWSEIYIFSLFSKFKLK